MLTSCLTHFFTFVRCVCLSLCVCFSGSVPGMRPAEAGEFTRRAFQAGKLGLTEVGQQESVKLRRDRSAYQELFRVILQGKYGINRVRNEQGFQVREMSTVEKFPFYIFCPLYTSFIELSNIYA